MHDGLSDNPVDDLARSLDAVDLASFYGPLTWYDRAIQSSLARLANDTGNAQQHAISDLTEHRRRALARYSLRAAMLVLRTRDPAHLYAGLYAHVLLSSGQPNDWRDDLVHFAPYYHAAQTVGVGPTALFDDAARHADRDLADLMRTFGRRTDVTPQVFGWRPVDRPDGPTYELIAWAPGRTGAFIGERSWDEYNRRQVEKIRAWIASSQNRPDNG